MIGTPALPDAPTAVLRGAPVDVDVRRIARVTVAACVAALVVASVALFWAGARHNSQVTALRRDGVPVAVTVTDCRGLMGGSGSNLVGYSCQGSFSLGGHRYGSDIPGQSDHAPGTVLTEITLAHQPGLLATPSSVRSEQATWGAFWVPGALLLVALTLTGVAIGRRRNPGGTFG